MTEPFQNNSNNSSHAKETSEDLTGRDRLVSNVFFSWVAHFVFIIAGFVMPRMIDQRLGQNVLGIWDFAWSLVSYFSLVQMGINSSVNRYVARYRAAGNIASVNQIVSSASCILGFGGMLVLGLTITLSLLLPQLFGDRLGENMLEAQWVVFFLGASMSVEVSFSTFSSVLTGCHRWKLHNIIRSGWHAATVVGMILALFQGGSLVSLAVISFVGLVLAYMTRVLLVHFVCEGLRLRPSLIRWETIRKLALFGGKTLIPSVSDMLLIQTVNILIIVYLGPAMLALFARPRSLIRHMHTLVKKMAMTLTPTTSSLQSAGDMEGIQGLLVKSVKYSLYMVLPMVMVLMVFGGPILRFWMGSRYANGLVPAILSVGYLANTVQMPVVTILVGMNAHGRSGAAYFVTSLCSVGLAILVLGYLGWGLAGIAIAVTLPLTIMNVFYLPYLICRRVGLGLRQYLLSVTVKPVVHILPFAICLVVARIVFHAEGLTGLIWGGTVGGTILAVLYWQYVLPDRIKTRVLCYMGIINPIV